MEEMKKNNPEGQGQSGNWGRPGQGGPGAGGFGGPVSEERLAQLKKDNPEEYEKVMARMAEMQKRKEEMKDQKDVTGEKKRPEGPDRSGQGQGQGRQGPGREKQLEKMKQDNPEMYKITTRKDALVKEIADMFKELEACEKNCGGKK